MKPIEQAELFKKYILELVNAAIPPLRDNSKIMEQGCDCAPIIEEDEKVNTIDLFLATMCIGKDYYSDLQILRQAPDINKLEIKPGLMKNIRKIIAIFQSSPHRFQMDCIDEIIRQYVLRRKRRASSAPGTSRYDESLKLATRCFTSMITIYHGDNERYFKQLIKGFQIAGQLIEDDDKDLGDDSRWDEIDTIIEDMSESYLITPDSVYMEEEVEKFLESLNENNRVD